MKLVFLVVSLITSLCISIMALVNSYIPQYKIDNNVSTSDTISVANTYIVFVTLIFVIATIIITIAVFYFTKQYTRTKEGLLSDNIDEVVKSLIEEEKNHDKVIESFLQNENVQKKLISRLEKLITYNAREAVSNLREEQVEYLSQLQNELKNEIEQIAEKIVKLETKEPKLFAHGWEQSAKEL